MVSGKILENCNNNQLHFLLVYGQYESVKGIVKIIELASSVEKTFLHLLRRLRTRTDERTQRKVQNTKSTLKPVFLTKCQEWCHLYTLAFFTGKSERADILDIETTNDDLSFQIIKSKIKVLADAGSIQSWSVLWRTLS